jgi:flagellar biogenesis protein FliO
MANHRDRRAGIALGLFALLLQTTLTPRWAASEDDLSFDPPAAESSLLRPSPFYEGDEPVIAPRDLHVQRLPGRVSEAPVIPPVTNKIGLSPEATRTAKTPLPASDFEAGTEPASPARGRSGFGSSVAWALGILAVGWLVRQFLVSRGPLATGAPAAIELLSRQSIGPQQQLALVRFGRRILLVGTTPTGMSTLATVDDPVEVQAIVAELRPITSKMGPTLLDLFRGQRGEPTRDDSAPVSVSLSTTSRAATSERRTTPLVNREVADV